MLVKGRKEDEQWEQDGEKESHMRVMNPLTLDCHVHVATTQATTFRHLLSHPLQSHLPD